MRREGELDPAGTAADHGKAQPPHLRGPREKGLPAPCKMVDRLDRDRVLRRPWNIVRAWLRADVERQQIVADRRMIAGQHQALRPVEADRFVADQPCAGKTRQPAEIDVAFLKPVMPGHITGQHARIRGFYVSRDQGHAHPRHRAHAKAFQHMDMRVAATHENEIPVDCDSRLHPRNYARALGTVATKGAVTPRGRRFGPKGAATIRRSTAPRGAPNHARALPGGS